MQIAAAALSLALLRITVDPRPLESHPRPDHASERDI